MIDVLLGNWELIVIGLLLAALAGSSAYIKYLAGRNDTLVFEKANLSAALQVSQTSVVTLQSAIDEQNTAIDKLKNDAAEREKSNAVIIAKAKVASANNTKRSAEIINLQPPNGVTSCDAANSLFNSEITNEK